MRYEYDRKKSRKNQRDASRGFEFDHAEGLDWDVSVTLKDDRKDYGEERYITYAPIDGRLHVLVWTPRRNACRVISLRKANAREREFYETQS